MLQYAIAFAIAWLLSVLLTPLARRLAFRIGSVHYPKAISIDTHVDPIPYLGGIPIFLAFNTVCTIFFVISGDFFAVFPVLAAATIVAVGGLIDDAWPLSVAGKFIAQIVATILVLIAGANLLQMPAIFSSPLLNAAIGFIFIVGLMNALNFLDIMDGLSSGVSAFVALGFGALAIAQGHEIAALMGVILAGAAAGFLVFNFNPARIFMGDTGSQFLGFVLALFPSMLLKEPGTTPNWQLVIAALVVLGVPLFEITYTSTIRTLTGKAPWKGSKDHFALRSFAMGYSVRGIVLTTYAACLTLAITGLFLLSASVTAVIATILILLTVAIAISLWLSRISVPKPLSAASQHPIKPLPKTAVQQTEKV